MFLYNNNIVSENSLTVTAEPVENFFEESIRYNKQLLADSLAANKVMLETIQTYGDEAKIVNEAFADFKTKIVKFLKEFKAKVVILFRRWMDWIAKKLHMTGRYSDKAAENLFADKTKCAALAGFKLVLTEPVDFGFTYFNELKTQTYPENMESAAEALYNARSNKSTDKSDEGDTKKLRDDLMNQTTGFLNGTKMTEIKLDDFKAIFKNKEDGKDNIKKYEKKVMDTIDYLNKLVASTAQLGNNGFKDSHAASAIVTMVSCLQSHLASMMEAHKTYVNRIDQLVAEFLPQAEQYLMTNG